MSWVGKLGSTRRLQAAQRKRRQRERDRKGKVQAPRKIEFDEVNVVEWLIEIGVLRPQDAGSIDKVLEAIEVHLERESTPT